MNEGDTRATGAIADPGFDHRHSRGFGSPERRVEIGRREADVMDTGSAPGEVPGDGRVVIRRLEEFDPACGVTEEHNADMLRGNFVFAGRVSSE